MSPAQESQNRGQQKYFYKAFLIEIACSNLIIQTGDSVRTPNMSPAIPATPDPRGNLITVTVSNFYKRSKDTWPCQHWRSSFQGPGVGLGHWGGLWSLDFISWAVTPCPGTIPWKAVVTAHRVWWRRPEPHTASPQGWNKALPLGFQHTCPAV